MVLVTQVVRPMIDEERFTMADYRNQSDSAPEDKPEKLQLNWHDTSTIPREDTEIVFEWFEERFIGEYKKNITPGNVSWLISFPFPNAFRTSRWIKTNQITRWAYADGSR